MRICSPLGAHGLCDLSLLGAVAFEVVCQSGIAATFIPATEVQGSSFHLE